jgi:ubiquinone/menaquinone biosynthesis C-methylase UbiE
MKKNNLDTGWGKVASWYESTIDSKFSYQKDVILPALLKFVLRENIAGKNILDLGCGTGFFLDEFAKYSPQSLIGIDLDEELLNLATSRLKDLENINISLQIASAEKLSLLKEKNFDFIFAVESLVNMQNLPAVANGISEKLSKNGKFIAVINHPAFRIPQHSDWYFDEKTKKQGRIIYSYKTSKTIKIDMNPSKKSNKKYTYTFHRSFEEYVNIFIQNGLYVSKMREVCSPKKSESGPRQKAENEARNEIPLFLILEFAKL